MQRKLPLGSFGVLIRLAMSLELAWDGKWRGKGQGSLLPIRDESAYSEEDVELRNPLEPNQ